MGSSILFQLHLVQTRNYILSCGSALLDVILSIFPVLIWYAPLPNV
jgi:hypothetical protein